MNAEMLKLVASGKVKPLIEKVLPFDQIKEGLQVIKNHRVVGKIVVKVNWRLALVFPFVNQHYYKGLLMVRNSQRR